MGRDIIDTGWFQWLVKDKAKFAGPKLVHTAGSQAGTVLVIVHCFEITFAGISRLAM
mgnify:CR=1 FL=1